ncbi:MAG: NAD(P)-dependent glycerol-3-phosphate dehydrogenase [Comamonas sp.]|nr:NAD(P)-dependent glycerol-3-phosphate dehydrogenase [Comamonas sp.]
MNILVIGAGAWGTAIALAAARHPSGHQVQLWARDSGQAAAMQQARCNARYLPGQAFPSQLQVTAQPLPALAQAADVVIIGTPMAALRQYLTVLAQAAINAPVLWLCKGFEAASQPPPNQQPPSTVAYGLMAHEIAAAVAPQLRCGALSGPSFALEVARGQPTCLVAASPDLAVRQAAQAALHSQSLRLYANADMVGVEVGGAVKNVLAIAAGLCDGLALGLNARAALLTRGLAEMSRLGLALGAKADTFMGLSGMGDLLLTATGDLSRNRKVGLLLAQGLRLEQAVQSLGHVAEGVYSARTVVQRAQALGVEMPIATAVVQLLDGQLQPQQALAQLMARDPKEEGARA